MRSRLAPAFSIPAQLLAAGFLGTLAIRLATLDMRQVWVDEALTQFAVSLGWRDLVGDRLAAGHSPLYFLLIKALGLDPAAILSLRAVSALLDSAACAILGAALLRVRGMRAAAFGMSLYALSPLLLTWAQNARPYALMMLGLALGLYGAAGLIAAAAARRPAPWDALAFTLGLTLAALTLTAGAIAALLVILVPLAMAPLRQKPGAWLRAAALPLAAVAAMALVVSLPAAAVQSVNHWTDRAAPFSPIELADLARAMVVGDRFRPDELRHVLGLIPVWWAAAAALALLAPSLIRGIRLVRATPALLPFAVLALAYPIVLLALSLGTSLLIPRYFLPALGPALMLAGAGRALPYPPPPSPPLPSLR